MLRKDCNKKKDSSIEDKVFDLQKDYKEIIHRIETIEHVLFEAKDVLTVEEAALFLGLSKSFIYKMTHEGAIPFYKPNGKVCFFEKADLLEWMRSTKIPSQEQVAVSAQQKLQHLACK